MKDAKRARDHCQRRANDARLKAATAPNERARSQHLELAAQYAARAEEVGGETDAIR